MKTFMFWAMVLGDAYAILCICLLLMLLADGETPPLTFTQMRN